MNDLKIRFFVTVTLPVTVPRERSDRGDVPGWVLITVMSAGLVGILYTVAKDELRQMLVAALNKVG